LAKFFDAGISTAGRSVRPLVIRFGALGDMVILLSMIRYLHHRLGAPVDVVSSGAATGTLLSAQPGVGEVFLIRSRKMPFSLSTDQWRLTTSLRKRGFTPTWNCDGDTPTRRLLAYAGIPTTHIVDSRELRRLQDEHEIDRWLRLAMMTPHAYHGQFSTPSLDPGLKVPPLVVSEQWRSATAAWLREKQLAGKMLILIQAGNKRTTKWWRPHHRASNTKYWPEENWARAIDAIASVERDAAFSLCGVGAERKLNEAIRRSATSAEIYNFAGELPLSRLLALQELATGMISVDTGPAHSAAALGCPLVVLFGTEDPTMYLPRSPHDSVSYIQAYEDGRLSMRAISVEDVISAWSELSRKRLRAHEPAPNPRVTSSLMCA
jgi:ADP-heptose:LPS heptosyltransferase